MNRSCFESSPCGFAGPRTGYRVSKIALVER